MRVRTHKGRGATFNPQGRYLPTASEAVEDGWEFDEEPEPAPETEFHADRTQRIITRNKSPDVAF